MRRPAFLPTAGFLVALVVVGGPAPAPAQEPLPALLARAEAANRDAVRRDANGVLIGLTLTGLYPLDGTLVGIPGLETLTELRLDQSDLTDAGMAALAGMPGLTELHLEATRVTDAGLVHLAGLAHLGTLELASTEVTGVGFEPLAGLPVSWLRLNGSPVTDEGLRHVAALSRLSGLFLSHTQAGDAGAAELARCKTLQYLELTGTRITDAGLARLAELPELQDLKVAGTGITDAGIATLAGLKKLRHLDVRGTAVTPAGLEPLKALPALEELGVTVLGTGQLQALKGFPRLKSVYLDLRGVPEPEVTAFYKESGASGGMSSSPAPTPEQEREQHEQLLARLKALDADARGALDLSIPSGGGEEMEGPAPSAEVRFTPSFADLDAIVSSGKVRRLDLGGQALRDRHVLRLAGLTGLTALRLASPYYDTDFGTRNFGSGVADRGLEILAGMAGLEELDLWGTRLAGPALRHVEKMTRLTSLNLGYTFVSGARLRHLRPCAALRRLNLSFTRTFDADLAHLSGLTQLEHLDLAATRITDAGLAHLRGLKSLRSLDLTGTRIGLPAVQELQQAIPELKVSPASGAPAESRAPSRPRSDMW